MHLVGFCYKKVFRLHLPIYTCVFQVVYLDVPRQNPASFILFPIRATRRAHLIPPDFITLKIFGEDMPQMMKLLITFSPNSYYFLTYRPEYIPQQPTVEHPVSFQISVQEVQERLIKL